MRVSADDVLPILVRLRAAGWQPSAEVVELLDTARDVPTPDQALQTRRDALAAAASTGEVQAIAEAQEQLAIMSNVSRLWEAHHLVRAEYAARAVRLAREDAFAFARERYDAAGAAFAAAIKAVPPDERPEAVMTRPKAQRDAWASVPELVAELEAASVLLGDVVHRFGGRTVCRRYRATRDPRYAMYPLGLLVQMNDAHPRRVIEAWCWTDQPPARVNPQPPTALDRICRGRGGRWAAILATGAELRCPCARLGEYEPFPLLEPVRVGDVVHDPYDDADSWAAYQSHLEHEESQRIKREDDLRRVGAEVPQSTAGSQR